jgi:hypothetical protein
VAAAADPADGALQPHRKHTEDFPAEPPSPGVSALDEVFGVGIEDVNVGPMADDTPSDDSQEKGDPSDGKQ